MIERHDYRPQLVRPTSSLIPGKHVCPVNVVHCPKCGAQHLDVHMRWHACKCGLWVRVAGARCGGEYLEITEVRPSWWARWWWARNSPDRGYLAIGP